MGDPIPDFTLHDTEGRAFSRESLKGKPYAIAVFATWCPPCKEELTALETQVWKPLLDKGITVLGINFGEEDSDTIARFKSDMGLSFPLLIDETGAYRKTLGVNMIPQSLVVDANGTIIGLHEGFTDEGIKEIGKGLMEHAAK